MPPSHEKLKPKFRRINFTPQGFPDPNSEEFLAQLINLLKDRKFDIKNVVFSGTDEENMFGLDGSLSEELAIFGMNEAGWRDAIRKREETPGGYATTNTDVPTIALYDGTRLTQPKSYELRQDEENYRLPVRIGSIVMDKTILPIGRDELVEEVVVHVGYPTVPATEALLGLVIIQDEAYAEPKASGL